MSAAELIQVDFKEGKITGRRQLPEKGATVPDWKATKDPMFREFVKTMAASAEFCHESGGDWRRLLIIMCDQPPGMDPFCHVISNESVLSSEDALCVLGEAGLKLSAEIIANEGPEPA